MNDGHAINRVSTCSYVLVVSVCNPACPSVYRREGRGDDDFVSVSIRLAPFNTFFELLSVIGNYNLVTS